MPVRLIIFLFALGSFLSESPQCLAQEENQNSLEQQAQQLTQEGKYQQAIPITEKLVGIRKKELGLEHRETVKSLDDLATLYWTVGDYAKAEPLFKQALEIRQKVLGPQHPDTASSLDNLATLYWTLGDYAKAEPLYREVLEKVPSPRRPKIAKSLETLAALYRAGRDNIKAEPLLKEALEIRQKVLGPDHPDTALSLSNLAKLYQDTGDYAKAEPLSKEALEIRRKVLGPQHPDTATSLDNLATLYWRLGDYAKAEPLFKEALEIRQKVLGSQHPDTALTLNNLAELYRAMGEYAKAEPLYQEALKIRQKVLGPQHPDTASSLDNLATLYWAMGEPVKVEPLFKEALEIRQKALGLQHPDTAKSLTNMAGFYWAMGKYGKAEPLLKEALKIRQKVLGPQHPDTALSLHGLAALYYAMGDYDKAEPLCKQALEIRQKVLGPQHPDTALSLSNLAALYQDMGDYAKAEPLFKEALEVRQKVLGPQHPDTAFTVDALAMLYYAMGEYDKAEPPCREALEIRQKVLGPQHPRTAQSLHNLATIYWRLGDYAKAEPLFKEALEIRQKVLGPQHPDTALTLNNLAMLYWAMGDYAKAEPLLKGALEVCQEVYGPQHFYTAKSLNNLAGLELDLGEIQEAKRLGQLGYAADLKGFSQILSFGSEDQRLAYQQVLNPYGLFAALGDSDSSLASAVLHYKGVVLDSIIEDRLLAETGKEEANQHLVDQLSAKKRMLAQLSLQATATSPKETIERVRTLEQELEDIEGNLARQITDLGQARRALTITVEQVQAALPNDTVLVEYVRYLHYVGKSKGKWRYGAVLFSADAQPRWVSLGSAPEIDAALRDYQDLVRAPGADDEMAAILQKLHQGVWEPVQRMLSAKVRTVIISPDGQLNFLSFATLLDGDHHFVAEKYSIRYVASGRDLLREGKATQNNQAVVFANPKFDKDLSHNIQITDGDLPTEGSGVLHARDKRGFDALSFGELGGTQQESDLLLPKFKQWGWSAKPFTGPAATKQALLELRGPYILHLATHGFFEPEEPSSDANSKDFESPASKLDLTKVGFFKNPMRRSGLALSGANSTLKAWKNGEAPPAEEDGILTAEDVSTLDLKGTWLVTLSACDTGSGEARTGEGVMGLRRGFIEAGAQNLLMTLWPIDDKVTMQVMRDFYEAAHDTGRAPQALAEIQREWLVQLREGQGEKFEKIKEYINGHGGIAQAVSLAGPFIMSSQGNP